MAVAVRPGGRGRDRDPGLPGPGVADHPASEIAAGAEAGRACGTGARVRAARSAAATRRLAARRPRRARAPRKPSVGGPSAPGAGRPGRSRSIARPRAQAARRRARDPGRRNDAARGAVSDRLRRPDRGRSAGRGGDPEPRDGLGAVADGAAAGARIPPASGRKGPPGGATRLAAAAPFASRGRGARPVRAEIDAVAGEGPVEGLGKAAELGTGSRARGGSRRAVRFPPEEGTSRPGRRFGAPIRRVSRGRERSRFRARARRSRARARARGGIRSSAKRASAIVCSRGSTSSRG